jgi:enoyl-CoA hydratase/carnithine racemase
VGIERDDRDGIAVVRLAHGPVNALDRELLTEITATFRELDASEHRAIVLTGAGRAFSAGVDLRRVVEGGEAYVREYLPLLSDTFEALFDIGKPVVAAVNGHAIAGGAIFVSAADYRLMAGGRIGVPELLVGVPFPTAALEILRYAVGDPRALVLSGSTVEATEAVPLRLVDQAVTADDLMPLALAEADRLATMTPASTFRLTKRQLHADARAHMARKRNAIDGDVVQAWVTRVRDGTIAAYLESLRAR